MKDNDLKVLVVGGGGREHALASKLAESSAVSSVFCAPGNAGTAQLGNNIDIKVTESEKLKDFASKQGIDLVVCGPETPLIAGLGDVFLDAGIPFWGPLSFGAQLEGSKVFAKTVMLEAGVPTADWEAFADVTDAMEAAKKRLDSDGGVVIKADGEAAGKGVFVCATVNEAQEALNTIMVKKAFGASGERVIVEQALKGQEVSVMVIATGEAIIAMPPVQDHKRAFDNDEGPNTGGMGCYTPVSVMPPALHEEAIEKTVMPILRWMGIKGMPYFGCLYAGLMLTEDGIKVLEYNCRLGDPETQVVMPMLQNDFGEIMIAAVSGKLDEIKPIWHNGSGVCVVLASGGYPGEYESGIPISGLEQAVAQDVFIYHAGTAVKDGQIVTAGGRVLSVTALGSDFAQARATVYNAVQHIKFNKMHFRKDIGAKNI